METQEKQTKPKTEQNTFWRDNKNPLLAIGAIILLLIMYTASRNKTEVVQQNTTNDEQKQEEMMADALAGKDQPKPATPSTPANPNTPTTTTKNTPAGNFSVSGTLRPSDNPSKGAYVLESSRGMIYLKTSRDFNNLLNMPVTMSANGTILGFSLQDITKAGETPSTDTTAKGGSTEEPLKMPEPASNSETFRFMGTLQQTDNPTKGNYLIRKDKTVIYLQTKQDYTAWLDTNVELVAEGTQKAFSNVKLKQVQ